MAVEAGQLVDGVSTETQQGPESEVKKRFLRISIPKVDWSEDPAVISNTSNVQEALSRFSTMGGIGRLLEMRNDGDWRQFFFSVSDDFSEANLYEIAEIYAECLPCGMVMNRLALIDCRCEDFDRCVELDLRDLSARFKFDYTVALNRLRTNFDLEEENGPIGKLMNIVDLAAKIDPEGLMDFDVRLNRVRAEGFGCEEVVQHQARISPFGPEHISDQELKTLCYKVNVSRPRGQEPFFIVVNTMANKSFNPKKIKALLKSTGLGSRFDIRTTEIDESFGISKGEVHPLSLVPRHADEGSGESSVIHIYDSALREPRYVTTNGGHPNWTTEFRSDTFIDCVRNYFNKDGRSLVLVDDIVRDDPEARSTAVDAVGYESNPSWESSLEVVLDYPTDVPVRENGSRKAALLLTETTTLFSEMVRGKIADLFEEDDLFAPVVLRKLSQPSLDFDVVKFPQCWRRVFEQMAIAVATMVKEGINNVFLDCNIAPLEELLSGKMPRPAKEYVIKILRAELGELLSDVDDDELLAKINQRLVLLSKPVVVAEYINREFCRGDVSEVYLVGGSQIADPSISKYHESLMSVRGLTVNTLDPEQAKLIRDAMYFAEYTDRVEDARFQNVLSLYRAVNPLVDAIESAENPLIVIASTSLSQAYHENGEEIIPEAYIEDLAGAVGLSVEEMQAQRRRINAIRVLNSTKVYADAAALSLATSIQTYGYQYV